MRSSFTSADNFPTKLLPYYEEFNTTKKVRPVHLQMIPTNKCGMGCDFCSCADEDPNEELSLEDAINISNEYIQLGIKAVTITGGGEPFLYNDLYPLVYNFTSKGVEVGVVSNGVKFDERVLELVRWCRISCSDQRILSLDRLTDVVRNHNVDWAFSYVVTENPNEGNMRKAVEFAEKEGFTHVRFVADILNSTKITIPKIDSPLSIVQPRTSPTIGGRCYICHLKPVVGADGFVYPCCGAQYAITGLERRMPDILVMGPALSARTIHREGLPFYFPCDVCYYSSYNQLLERMMEDVEHETFV